MKKIFFAAALFAALSFGFVSCENPDDDNLDYSTEQPNCNENTDTSSAGIGVFSVSSTKQVSFSKGNLQYTRSTDKWSFAKHQWECIGMNNVTGGSISSYDCKRGETLTDKIDLFGWSAINITAPFGVSTSENYEDYSGYFIDWGANQIGADAPNTWRTLTYDEWDYLRWERPNYSSLCGVAQVNGVNGLILLPDAWVCPEDITFKSGFHDMYDKSYYAAYQTLTADEWRRMEAEGAVFLPAAGYRIGATVIFVQFFGDYWSSTPNSIDNAWDLGFVSSGAYVNYSRCYYGQSVRLVKDL